jgi:phosphoserine / homoserine phosphotransferase
MVAFLTGFVTIGYSLRPGLFARNHDQGNGATELKCSLEWFDSARDSDKTRSVSTSSSLAPAPGNPQQSIVTLDLEGVLVPEIWIAVAEKTGVDALQRTTHDVLMQGRIALLNENDLKMSDIEAVIATLSPLDGAVEFLDSLRERTQVIILSDTFEQFGRPLMRHLHWPTLLCHRLIVDNDRIVGYKLRMQDQKRHAVNALRELNYRVVSAGDSYNDTAMLGAAHAGFLFHAPANVKAEFPQFKALDSFDDLRAHIEAELT